MQQKFYMEKTLNVATVAVKQNCGDSENKVLFNVSCKINDYRMRGVIDTDVSVCGINPSIAAKLNVNVEPILRTRLTTGDGSTVVKVGKFSGVIGLRGDDYPTEILVMEGLHDVLLLGTDFCIKARLSHSTVSSKPLAKDEMLVKECKLPAIKRRLLTKSAPFFPNPVTKPKPGFQLLQDLLTKQDPVVHLLQNSTKKQAAGLHLFQNSMTKQDGVVQVVQNLAARQDPVVHVFQNSVSNQDRGFKVLMLPPASIIPCNCPYVQLHPCRCQVAGKCAVCKLSQPTEMTSQLLSLKEVRRIRDKIKRKLNLKRRPRRKKAKLVEKSLNVPAPVDFIVEIKDTKLMQNRKFKRRRAPKPRNATLLNSDEHKNPTDFPVKENGDFRAATTSDLTRNLSLDSTDNLTDDAVCHSKWLPIANSTLSL